MPSILSLDPSTHTATKAFPSHVIDGRLRYPADDPTYAATVTSCASPLRGTDVILTATPPPNESTAKPFPFEATAWLDAPENGPPIGNGSASIQFPSAAMRLATVWKWPYQRNSQTAPSNETTGSGKSKV